MKKSRLMFTQILEEEATSAFTNWQFLNIPVWNEDSPQFSVVRQAFKDAYKEAVHRYHTP